LPAAVRERFPPGASLLERYAAIFPAVEITSSFYRLHRRTTYERWADTVPADFRFAVKLPRAITHQRRLCDVDEPLERFLDESAGLGSKLAVLLVQLPPRLAYSADVVAPFVAALRARFGGRIAWEPRHPGWFSAEVDRFFATSRIARVAADPPVVASAGQPGGTTSFAYFRWHGSPQVYSSSYADRIDRLAARVAERSGEVWCIFDNTRLGAATADALDLWSSVSDDPPR
jgi:uncharacterized protein YecE (DUF72 family)